MQTLGQSTHGTDRHIGHHISRPPSLELVYFCHSIGRLDVAHPLHTKGPFLSHHLHHPLEPHSRSQAMELRQLHQFQSSVSQLDLLEHRAPNLRNLDHLCHDQSRRYGGPRLLALALRLEHLPPRPQLVMVVLRQTSSDKV